MNIGSPRDCLAGSLHGGSRHGRSGMRCECGSGGILSQNPKRRGSHGCRQRCQAKGSVRCSLGGSGDTEGKTLGMALIARYLITRRAALTHGLSADPSASLSLLLICAHTQVGPVSHCSLVFNVAENVNLLY